MSKSQEIIDGNVENNGEITENYSEGGGNQTMKNPPIRIPLLCILILLGAIYLAINFFFFPPNKSIGGALPKNEYIKFMKPAKPKIDVVQNKNNSTNSDNKTDTPQLSPNNNTNTDSSSKVTNEDLPVIDREGL